MPEIYPAAQALLGRAFRVTRQRGELIEGTGLAPIVMATVHPSSVLRSRDTEKRQEARARFQADLERIAPLVSGPSRSGSPRARGSGLRG